MPIARIAPTVATALALLALAGTAAANTTGQIQLRGEVPKTCTIAVSDLNQSLDLTVGEPSKVVGTVVETCNSGTGYTVSISSRNNGQLMSNSEGAPPIAYTVGYDGQSQSLATSMAVPRTSAQFGKNVNLVVSLPGAPNAIAGTYTDTLTITVAAR